MSKRKSKTQIVTAPRKKNGIVGTIKGLDVLLHREGRVTFRLNPEIASHVHVSKKDYDRKDYKSKVRAQINEP